MPTVIDKLIASEERDYTEWRNKKMSVIWFVMLFALFATVAIYGLFRSGRWYVDISGYTPKQAWFAIKWDINHAITEWIDKHNN
jgi:hypothetical protein